MGSLPPVVHNPAFASTAIGILPSPPIDAATGKPGHQFYSILIHGVMYGSPEQGSTSQISNSTSHAMVVDSGTNSNSFAISTAEAINALFDSPAVLDRESGNFIVNCDARAPQPGIKIGGQVIYHNGADLIITMVSVCAFHVPSEMLGLMGAVFSISGAPSMKNVVSLFRCW